MHVRTPLLGWGLAALWLGWVVTALAGLRQGPDEAQTARLRDALDRLAPQLAARAPGEALAVRLPPACACAPDAADAAWQAIGRAVGAVQGRAIDLPDGLPAPARVEWLLLAADGRMVYAGPLAPDAACGHPLPVAPLVPALLSARSTAPLVLPSSCPSC